MDSYQAVYDAVRSRISNGDVGQAVRDAIGSGLDASSAIYILQCEFANAAIAMQRPSVLHRPAISIDGNQWCALYGENLQDGLAGFGDTPELAMQDFDTNWRNWNARIRAENIRDAKVANGQLGVGA